MLSFMPSIRSRAAVKPSRLMVSASPNCPLKKPSSVTNALERLDHALAAGLMLSLTIWNDYFETLTAGLYAHI